MNFVKSFIYYWYMRYLMVTELYMVEKWERRMFYMVALVLLAVLGLMNYLFLVGGINYVSQLLGYQDNNLLSQKAPYFNV